MKGISARFKLPSRSVRAASNVAATGQVTLCCFAKAQVSFHLLMRRYRGVMNSRSNCGLYSSDATSTLTTRNLLSKLTQTQFANTERTKRRQNACIHVLTPASARPLTLGSRPA